MNRRQMTGELVRTWAESILQQVAAPPDATLTVTARPGTGDISPPEPGTGSPESALESSLEQIWNEEGGALRPNDADDVTAAAGPTDIVATLTFADGSAVSVELAAGTRETDAVVLLADRFQDAVLEETGGTPRPPCPGHGHPAVAAEVAGVPRWTCPHGMGRTTRRILPDVG
ncbi:hypothetical protein [Streptomyces sp. 3N207]|uniref:hypothetical protein n=1 Tax=Streptomyces sp. 3N207 TaxID=3457417 RepID=UPI003FD1EDA4